MPVQWVNRPNNPKYHALHDFRGLSGQIARGIVKTGQQVMVLPAGIKTTIKQIWTYDGLVAEAFAPQSVTLCLQHNIDVSRGDMIVDLDDLPGMGSELRAHVCWMNQRPLQRGKKYFLKHAAQTVMAVVTSLDNRTNIQTFEPESEPSSRAPRLAIGATGQSKTSASRSTNRLGLMRSAAPTW